MDATLDLYCPDCGYNLRGIDSRRCPECGAEFDRDRLTRSRLPWVHRKAIGWPRAYWRTLLVTTFRPRQLAAEAAGPVSLSDARRFWLATVLIAFIPLGGLIVAAHLALDWNALFGTLEPEWGGVPTHRYDLLMPLLAGASFVFVPLLGALLFLLAATGVAGYFFHPRSLPVVRQNRAAALSYYACGPLGWMPITASAFAIGWAINHFDLAGDPLFGMSALAAAAVVFFGVIMQVVLWHAGTLRLLRQTTDAGLERVIAAGVALPILWVILAGVTLVALSWLVGLIWLMIASLR